MGIGIKAFLLLINLSRLHHNLKSSLEVFPARILQLLISLFEIFVLFLRRPCLVRRQSSEIHLYFFREFSKSIHSRCQELREVLLQALDDLGVWCDSVSVVPSQESIVKVSLRSRIELKFLDYLTTLADGIASSTSQCFPNARGGKYCPFFL